MAADSLSDSSVGIASPSHRLPASTRLGRVQLQVADLARSRAFYEKILGLRVLDMSMDGHAVLGSQEDDTPLVELVERPGAKPSPSRGRLGLFHVAFLLPERAALGRFIRHLAEHGIEPGRSDHRVSEAVYLRDPDGLGIEVYADRPRATWTVDENGQIVMTTEPLNVDDLLRVAGDAAWRGAPAGTTVGHVHLHVGDLGRAAAFYHEALGLDKVVWNYPGARRRGAAPRMDARRSRPRRRRRDRAQPGISQLHRLARRAQRPYRRSVGHRPSDHRRALTFSLFFSPTA